MCSRIFFRKGAGSLSDQIVAAGYGGSGLCGGRGACGKCRVRFPGQAPLPSSADRKFFTPAQLREGYRLACTSRPGADCEVEICYEREPEMAILTATDETAPDGDRLPQAQKLTAHTEGLFCAVDLGTTTVVMQLIEKREGTALDTYAFPNPQRVYGVDVLARITAAGSGKAQALREVLLAEMEKGLHRLEQYGRAEQIVVSGNTTMGHLLLGYPVESLGRAPFTPYHIESSKFVLCGYPAIFLPGISAFVGADIVSGMYACKLAEREELSLFIDLGTNGEMAVGSREGILCTATAAGSAFEGGVSSQVMGTDMTALAGDMLAEGVLDETGLMREPWFTEGFRLGEIMVSQKDIRNLQMAKAAICAGASILLDRMDAWEKISRVYLAGGFGYYLDVDKAVGIGLIPGVLQGKCRAVGNTSLAGAIRYGRNTQAGSSREEEKLRHIVEISRSLNLAQQPEFENRYIEAMTFGRM